MEFFLPFKVLLSNIKISYTDKILLTGSCFSEEIGNRMKDIKFQVMQNPNGISYDPVSISNALMSYTNTKQFTADDIFQAGDIWYSWQHHSVFSGLNKDEILQQLNEAKINAHHFLKNASWLIVTVGTSYSYQLKESAQPVANCHKLPQGFFDKRLLFIDEITGNMSHAISVMREFNPGLKIILTVSPVRHAKDGLVENNRSKARLIESMHSLTEQTSNVFYFPAYELVIDILRDYRFYNDDLVHPSDAAVNFVFESFCNAYLDDMSRQVLSEVRSIRAAINHRPFQKESLAHKSFLEAQLENIKVVSKKFPFLDFSSEEKYFKGG